MNTMSAYELTCVIAKANAYDRILKAILESATPEDGGKATMSICLETCQSLIELTKNVKGGE